jgi:hypothetical protein
MTLKMHNNAFDDDFEWKYSNEGNPYISSTRKTHNVNKLGEFKSIYFLETKNINNMQNNN